MQNKIQYFATKYYIPPRGTDAFVPTAVFLFPENIAEKTNLFSAGGYELRRLKKTG